MLKPMNLQEEVEIVDDLPSKTDNFREHPNRGGASVKYPWDSLVLL